MYKENSFHSIKFSTDHGYATSLDMTVYSWKEDIENGKSIMQIEFRPIEYGKDYDIADDKAVARERMRIHKDMIDTSEGYSQENAIRHYHEGLDDTDRKKDKRPINNFLKVLARDDGIRVYRLDLKKNGNNE
jgi:hypothetical protein